MQERLLRMDKAVKKVIENLSEDALLLLYGDHGMTDDGNHGGARGEETDAALVVYSRGRSADKFYLWYATTPNSVQIDLVPTLSLCGLPVPWLLPAHPRPVSRGTLAEARLTTSLRVMRYLRAYGLYGQSAGKDLAEAASVLEEGMRLHREGTWEEPEGVIRSFLATRSSWAGACSRSSTYP